MAIVRTNVVVKKGHEVSKKDYAVDYDVPPLCTEPGPNEEALITFIDESTKKHCNTADNNGGETFIELE